MRESWTVAPEPSRPDPLWLRIVVALFFSCILGVLTLLLIGDFVGPLSFVLCGAFTVASTVLMAWKARRVSKIATWFFEMLSGM